MRSFYSIRSILVAGLAGVILLGLLWVVSPEARATAQGWIARFVEVESPQAVPPPEGHSPDKVAVRSETEQEKSIRIPAASSGEQLPPTVQPPEGKPDKSKFPPPPDVWASRDLISLDEAQARISFRIRVPTVLPEGHSFLGVVPAPELPDGLPELPALAPILPTETLQVEPPQMVILVFGNSVGERLTLSEVRMANPGSIEVPLPAGEGSVHQVTISGQPAQYVEGRWTQEGWVSDGNYQLHWKDADGIMYDLVSRTLNLPELLAVAESMIIW